MKKLPLILTITLGILALSVGYPLLTLGQSPADVGVEIIPGTLTMAYTPGSFTMPAVNIDSPVTVFYSIYVNPEQIDPDMNPATNDGTAVVIQDGRFDGGFTLTVQPGANFVSGGNNINASLFGVRTENTDISETLNTETGTSATTAPAESTTDFVQFPNAVILLNSPAACGQGRVGTYTVYPSFRLQIPSDTPAGNYTNTVTYSLIDDYRC